MPSDALTAFLQKRIANPLMRRVPLQTLLETTGRKSGKPRRTPLGGRRVSDEFWFVSEFGDRSQYIRNIKADPRVRVRLRGRWHGSPLTGRRPARPVAQIATTERCRGTHVRHEPADRPRRPRSVTVTQA